MLHIKPPVYNYDIKPEESIFLAGSISGAHDWQAGAAEKLLPYFNVINPRRDNYNNLDPKIEEEQITWEHYYLTNVDNILFYFSYETLAPITLFEYGTVLEKGAYDHLNVRVAVHPDYKRRNDVLIQTKLRGRGCIYICSDLEELIKSFITYETEDDD